MNITALPLQGDHSHDDFSRQPMFVSIEQLNFAKRKFMRHGTPGYSGVMAILGGIVGVGLLMTVVFGDVAQWIPIAFIVLVSLKAVQRRNR